MKRVVIAAPGVPTRMSFALIVAKYKPATTDLLVIKSASAQAPRLAFRPGDPDFTFDVAPTESIVIEIHPALTTA